MDDWRVNQDFGDFLEPPSDAPIPGCEWHCDLSPAMRTMPAARLRSYVPEHDRGNLLSHFFGGFGFFGD